MPKRVAISSLNASTLDILNTIRANASYEYQSLVPEITQETDIPKVGEIIYGTPALANQFLNALVNRIAMVKVKSATFNNAYAELKKGYLEFGETVEEVFVNICKAREFSAEKGEQREFKRSLPDVRSAFHIMNYRVQYPITIQDDDLKMAFLSIGGVQDLIAKIVNMVYTSAEYDEFLLFKYLMIKAIAHGKMYPVGIDMTNDKNMAIKFRGVSNQLEFMKTKYNANGVTTNTPKSDQYIFMDADLNAQFDVNVLASAFNMDKADFMGKLKLIDDWTDFDNERFSIIKANSDMIEDVTAEELALMSKVKAVLVDKEWFQIYDNMNKMTEQYSASGLYWNYFYNVWKTVSSSPFSNAVVFVDDTAETDLPASISVEVVNKTIYEGGTILTLAVDDDNPTLAGTEANFVQTADATENGIAVHKYGALIIPSDASAVKVGLTVLGTYYESSVTVDGTFDVGDTFAVNNAEYVDNTLSALTIGSVTLTPTFNKDVTSYTATTTNATNTITATATDEDATVVITVNGTTVQSGGTATWTAGANTVLVKVSGTSLKTYTVTVTKS